MRLFSRSRLGVELAAAAFVFSLACGGGGRSAADHAAGPGALDPEGAPQVPAGGAAPDGPGQGVDPGDGGHAPEADPAAVPVTAPVATWRAPLFDGRSGYVEIPDDSAYSQPTSGALTIEVWIRPDSLRMPAPEGSGYVHWMGKGVWGQQEWVWRMYQRGNAEDRRNRFSFYAFNQQGGLGAGCNFQDEVSPGEWIHVVGEIDATQTCIFKNGVLRLTGLLSSFNVVPADGTAPVRIGTRDKASFFRGSIARVAMFGAKLSPAQVAAHYSARAQGDYDQVVLAEPSLVGFWRLDETSGAVAVDAKRGNNGRYVGGVKLGAVSWTAAP
jgi:hypothetical protein